jgi:signal transduction histidine kinase
VLEIRDNGTGFTPPNESGFGIEAMGRRSEAIGAHLNISSLPGMGTVVSVRSPYGRRLTFADWFRHIWRGSIRRSEDGQAQGYAN